MKKRLRVEILAFCWVRLLFSVCGFTQDASVSLRQLYRSLKPTNQEP